MLLTMLLTDIKSHDSYHIIISLVLIKNSKVRISHRNLIHNSSAQKNKTIPKQKFINNNSGVCFLVQQGKVYYRSGRCACEPERRHNKRDLKRNLTEVHLHRVVALGRFIVPVSGKQLRIGLRYLDESRQKL